LLSVAADARVDDSANEGVVTRLSRNLVDGFDQLIGRTPSAHTVSGLSRERLHAFFDGTLFYDLAIEADKKALAASTAKLTTTQRQTLATGSGIDPAKLARMVLAYATEKNSIEMALAAYGVDERVALAMLRSKPDDADAAEMLRVARDNIARLNLTMAAIDQARLAADVARKNAVK
jgi:hypothetical protein